MLLLLIGFRAKRIDPTYSVHKFKVNEAFLGDYEVIGLTRSEYRTAIEKLEKDGLVKFQATPKGTIATLINKKAKCRQSHWADDVGLSTA